MHWLQPLRTTAWYAMASANARHRLVCNGSSLCEASMTVVNDVIIAQITHRYPSGTSVGLLKKKNKSAPPRRGGCRCISHSPSVLRVYYCRMMNLDALAQDMYDYHCGDRIASVYCQAINNIERRCSLALHRSVPRPSQYINGIPRGVYECCYSGLTYRLSACALRFRFL